MALSRNRRFSRGMGRFAAAGALVFLYRYTDFFGREFDRGADCLLHSCDRASFLLSTPLLPGLAVIFNNGNWLLAQIVIGIVQFLANVPGGHFYVEHPHWPEKLVAKIMVLDVGAGAAVHLQTGNANWLFDCGNERNYQRVVREYLHWAGINRLSGSLLTHGDALHLGGAAQLLDDFPQIRVVDNAAP